jgi:hypothetical protein
MPLASLALLCRSSFSLSRGTAGSLLGRPI